MCYGLRMTAVKLTFYGLIIAIWVASAAFIAIGSYLAAENPTTSYSAIFDEDYDSEVWETAVYTTIGLGAIIAGLTLAGFCGVRRQSNFLLFLFSLCMIVFLVVELALVIMAGVFKDDVKANIRDTMVRQVESEYVSETSGDQLSKDWNRMQQDLKCCGSNYYPDYFVLESDFYTDTGNLVPYTCCQDNEKYYDICLREASRNISDVTYLYKDGCAWDMLILVEDRMAMLVSTLCITGGIQIGAIIFACLLRDNFKHGDK